MSEPAARPRILVMCAIACGHCGVAAELRAMDCVVVWAAGSPGGLADVGCDPSPDAVLALAAPGDLDTDELLQAIRRHPALGHVPVLVGQGCANGSCPQELAAILAGTVIDARRL